MFGLGMKKVPLAEPSVPSEAGQQKAEKPEKEKDNA